MKFKSTQSKMKGLVAFITFITLIGCSDTKKETTPWVNLFDGKSLNGWHIIGGNATYEVKDGAIVGTSTLNSPNTFLCSEKMYGDFIRFCRIC